MKLPKEYPMRLYIYLYSKDQMNFADHYFENIKAVSESYKSIAERAIAQLVDKQLIFTRNEDSNSIAMIIRHLHGNMLSRWTDFLTTDGEKPWRKRDEEFEQKEFKKEEILKLWEAGWNCFFSALAKLKSEDLTKTVYIRSHALTVVEAINRQIAHYSYHIGQVIYAAKELKVGEWESLSIPKIKSAEFCETKAAAKK